MKRLLNRTIDRFGEVAMQEAELLDGHLFALRERFAVARRARNVGELLRDQVDLLPETRARLRRDHQARLALWRRVGLKRASPRGRG